MSEDPDRPLLSAVAEGREDALRELMVRHKEAVFRFAYRFLQNEADAAEIAAETFVRVYRNAAKFQPRAKVSTWIFTIASNLCRDHARKAWRHKVFSLFAPDADSREHNPTTPESRLADDQPNAGESLALRESVAEALAAVDALPLKLKSPFILQVLEEKSQRECAQILGISEKAVETRVYRARKRILNTLEHKRTSS